MGTKHTVLGMALTLLAPVNARPADWQLLRSNSSGSIYLDRSGIVYDHKVGRAWFKITYSSGQTVPMEAWSPYHLYPDAQIYDHVLHLFYFDCASRISSYPQSDYFNPTNQLVGRFALMVEPKFTLRPVEPETIDEILFYAVCPPVR